ncbi:MAG: isochorismate synthase [Bacteroidota bacterium]
MKFSPHIAESVSLSSEEYINKILQFSTVKGAACAAWRMPNEDQMHLILDLDGSQEITKITLEDVAEGFLLKPFDKSRSALHLKKDVYINLNNGNISSLSYGSLDELNAFFKREIDYPSVRSGGRKIKNVENKPFIHLVNKSLEEIYQGTFQKIVPSRNKRVELSETFNHGEFFNTLCASYPGAFVSMVYTPQSGLWMGASPELLLELDGDIFKTVALAGTQPYEGQSLTEVAWTQKEIEEQAFVSRYIINCFKKIRLREFEENGPKTVKAGNLIHLKTDFAVDMVKTNFQDLGSIMLELLHPTSAICGMPLEPSLNFLKEHELYDREYFSGYLGPIDFEDKTSLFVNLRCMKLKDDTATLYAGAGVTADSDPEKEWRETEMKMNTLLNLIP